MEKDFSILDSFEFGIRKASQHFGFFLKTYLIQIPYWILSLILPAVVIFSPFVWKGSKIASEFLALNKSTSTAVDYDLMSQYFVQRFVEDGLGWWVGAAFVALMFSLFISSVYMMLGYIKIGLNIVDGKKNTIGVLFSQRGLVSRGFLASLLVLTPFFFVMILTGLMYTFFPQISFWPSGCTQESMIWFLDTFSLVLTIPFYILMTVFSFFRYILVDENTGVIESFKISAKITRGVRFKFFLFILITVGLNYLLGQLPFILQLAFGLIMWPVSLLAYLHVYRTLKQQTVQE